MDTQTFTSASASGSIHPQGAHVLAWVPAGYDDVLWLSPDAIFEPGTPIRGGVPICFPWFSTGPDGDQTPMHGPARLIEWERVDGDDDGTTSVWQLNSADIPGEERAYTATYTVTFSNTLKLELTVTNHGNEPITFEEALHTYVRVGDVRQVSVEGLDGAEFADKVDGGRRADAGTLTFTGRTDRIYDTSATVVVNDPVFHRKITVERENSNSAIVWTPWEETAASMEDFTTEEWSNVLCIEGGNVQANAVNLAAGESHTMRYTLTVEPLD